MLVGATPASADSTDNDGLNIGNDNNLSVLPVQLCGNNIGVLGAVAPIGSPQDAECVNAPIVDHPEKPEKPEKPNPPTEHPQPPTEHPKPPTHHPKPPTHHPKPPVEHVSEELPTAPAPEVTEGHVAVTG